MARNPNYARLAELAAKKARREARRSARGATVSPSTPKDTTDMSKADTEVVCGLARTKLDRIIRNIDKARQEKDDGTTAHASAWKDAKEQGAPTDALKLCMKLDRMSEEKRDDFLKGFDALRGSVYRHWAAQPDMFEQATEPAPQPEAEVEAVGDDDGVEPMPLFEGADDAAGIVSREEGEETADGPIADWEADPANAASDAEFETAGEWFNDGKAAGMAGAPAEANPFEDGTLAASTWEKGRASGAAVAEEVNHYNAGWAAHKSGAERNAGDLQGDAAAEFLKGWDEREKKQARAGKKAAAKAEAEEPAAEVGEQGEGAEIVQFVPGMVAADAGAMAAAG